MTSIEDIPSPVIPSVEFSMRCVDDGQVYLLKAAEAEALSERASEIRKTEFRLGRAAANDCLRGLGFQDPPPVPQGPHRAPVWPEGIIGSISHSGRWAVAAVAKQADVRMIGVDIERVRPMSTKKLTDRIATEEEATLLSRHADSTDEFPFVHAAIFSAKEAIYKAFFGSLGVKLCFASISFDWEPNEMSKGEVCLYGTLTHDVNERYKKGFVFPVHTYLFKDRYALTYAIDEGM